jgi:hypothetical protein
MEADQRFVCQDVVRATILASSLRLCVQYRWREEDKPDEFAFIDRKILERDVQPVHKDPRQRV